MMRYLILLLLGTAVFANDKAETSLKSFHQALQQGDQKQALALLHDDAVIYESGHAETKAQYTAHHVKADIEFAKATKSAVKKSAAQCIETQCVFTRETETTGQFKSKDVHSVTLETAVLINVDGRWLITHIHWSTRNAH